MSSRVCSKCGVEKTLDRFRKNAKGKDGLDIRCKDCIGELERANYKKRLLNKEYEEEYKQKRREQYGTRKSSQEWVQARSEKAKEYYLDKSKDEQWLKEKRDRERDNYKNSNGRYLESSKKWASQNRDKINKSARKSRVAHPEKSRALSLSQRLFRKGLEKHHWSYLEADALDVIWLTNSDHNTIHRFIKYSKEHSKYFTLDGEYLETREEFVEYMNSINVFEAPSA